MEWTKTPQILKKCFLKAEPLLILHGFVCISCEMRVQQSQLSSSKKCRTCILCEWLGFGFNLIKIFSALSKTEQISLKKIDVDPHFKLIQGLLPFQFISNAHAKLFGSRFHRSANHKPVSRLKNMQWAGNSRKCHSANKDGHFLVQAETRK